LLQIVPIIACWRLSAGFAGHRLKHPSDVKSSLGYRSINRGVHVLPLPNLKAQCTAKNRKTGERCKNPAAFGCKSCRYHGARRQIRRGEQHPNYKHGGRTLEALNNYSQKVAELDHLEDIAHRAGVMAGPKRRGRKPTKK
jgi:hypothetical protein